MAKLNRSYFSEAFPFFLDMHEEELLCIQFALMNLDKGAAEAAGHDPDLVDELLMDITYGYLDGDNEESLPT